MLRLFGAAPLTFQLIRLALGRGLLGIWLPKPTWDRFYLLLLWLYATWTKARVHMTHDLWTLTTKNRCPWLRVGAYICGCLESVSGWYRANSFRFFFFKSTAPEYLHVLTWSALWPDSRTSHDCWEEPATWGAHGERLSQFNNKHNDVSKCMMNYTQLKHNYVTS